MMNESVIQIRDLGKRYTLGGQMRLDQTLPELIARQCRRLIGRNVSTSHAPNKDFWALRD